MNKLKEMCEFIEKYFKHRYFWSWLDDILRYCCNIEDLGLHIYKLVDQDNNFLVIERLNNANIMIEIHSNYTIREVLFIFIKNTFDDSDDSLIAFNKAYDKYISKKEKYEPILEKIDKITDYEINCLIELIDKASKRVT